VVAVYGTYAWPADLLVVDHVFDICGPEICEYVAPAVAAGIVPGGPAKNEQERAGWPGSGSRSWLTRGCGR
jgi:hypothetical protein